MIEPPLISVVVINYNGKEMLKRCLDAVFAQRYGNFEVIFVDNGSRDGSAGFVKEDYPEARVIVNDQNLGYASAANIGISRSAGEFVAILNNDTKADPAWLNKLVEALQEDPAIGSACPKQLKFNDPKIIDAAGTILHRGGYQFNRAAAEPDRGQYGTTEEIFGPSGAAAIYRRKMLEDVGSFDDDFFCYQEEFDLSMRARLRGWKSVYVPGSVIYHIGGRTMAEKEKGPLIYYMERNRLLTIAKDYPARIFAECLPYLFKYEIDILFRLFTRLEFAPIRARIDAMAMLPGMLKKRAHIQKSRVIKDDELKRWIAR